MKKAQWIEVHPFADIVRANVQEEGQPGVDLTLPLSALPLSVAVKMRAAVDALTAHLNVKPVSVDPVVAAAALSDLTGVALAPRDLAMELALAEAQAALEVAVTLSEGTKPVE